MIGPILYPPTSPLFKESKIRVEAVDEIFDKNNAAYEVEKGGIYKGKLQKYTVYWEEQKDATEYNVYGSFSPLFSIKKKLNKDVISSSQLSFNFYPPIIPEDFQVHFWVSKIVNNEEIFLQIEPATEETSTTNFLDTNIQTSHDIPINDPINKFMKYAYEEIRRRHKFILENDGEDAYLYIRRWFGTPCQCTDADSSDPDYQARGRCVLCYGTGIFGGYFPKIPIKIRYEAMPTRILKFEKFGVVREHNWTSWTLWSPKLHEHDILIRSKSGDKFEIIKPSQSEIRGLPFRQAFSLNCIDQNDILQQLSDEAILEAFQKENQSPFKRLGWEIFT